MHFLRRRLEASLPEDPRQTIPILLSSLKQEESDVIGLEGFAVWPLTQYVADRGLEHFDLSVEALKRMTVVFTAEFAIRPFLIRHEERTLKLLMEWTGDPSADVRRLVSEGSRPLLPWGERLTRFVERPEKTWPLLEALKADPALYVRKSVANHINDHSKNHGDWVVRQLKAWSESAKSRDVSWVIRHATRTLVKKGHSGALSLHGIKASRIRVVSRRILTPTVRLGRVLGVEVRLRNPTRRPISVILDHELSFLKNNGKLSPKVFKGAKLVLAPGESRILVSKLPIQRVTVRKYYAGKQAWAPMVNGKRLKPLSWLKLTGI